MIEIRTASGKDIEIIALLGRVTYSESHGHFIDNFSDLVKYNDEAFSIQKTKENLLDKNNIYFIMYADSFPVGYAKLVLHATIDCVAAKNVCRLERIYILNEFIGRQIGSKLLDACIQKATQQNFDELWLTTYIKNDKAIQFYQKQKFQRIGSYNFLVNGKGYENIVFSKELKTKNSSNNARVFKVKAE
ncbi:GNAT family N-acetyltransferase [Tenacibaculum caenipelagi]|uniref:Ribosomal protein S18 acetylase RimI-like enzyme n=1 Tax=Tenacibaculum caenipelagi TaxID=1325435 RepID=A0A4R6TF40_9FLAO|nr:GNAT family N-acetyltransferase [Tenacibaculum caenipelagi]TDQ25625.1 ribosomal protein S18 acetylase RimI-like enzyme [Tenacibaculum caenipelagi]